MAIRESIHIAFVSSAWDKFYGHKFHAQLEVFNANVFASEFHLSFDLYLILLSEGTIHYR